MRQIVKRFDYGMFFAIETQYSENYKSRANKNQRGKNCYADEGTVLTTLKTKLLCKSVIFFIAKNSTVNNGLKLNITRLQWRENVFT